MSVFFVMALACEADAQPTGKILYEYWLGIGGFDVNDLTTIPAYPDEPTGCDWLTSFDAPNNWSDNYGARIRGYLYPPDTGDYTFWISSDDSSELWLSSDEDPGNAVLIASVDGWCGIYTWNSGTAGSNQESSPISLTAGQKYYIEAIHKDGGGGDHVEAAWEGPTIEGPVVIDGAYLSQWIRPCDLMAGEPNPADNAEHVALDATLSWLPRENAASHDVYFGTNFNDVNDGLGGTFKGNQEANSYDPGALELDVTYYWRIDEVNGLDIWKGYVWSFQTYTTTASVPNPKEGMIGIDPNTDLSWFPGYLAASHDVYLGTSFSEVDEGTGDTFKGNYAGTTFEPGVMDWNTPYYWRIDAVNGVQTWKGSVWNFTTVPDYAYFIGLRRGPWGGLHDNDHLWWAQQAKNFAASISNGQPAGPTIIEIVSGYTEKGITQFTFPLPEGYEGDTENMIFVTGPVDHEKALSLFDELGVRVIIQFESGDASMISCLEIAQMVLGHHPCVVGYGIDAEWYFIGSGRDARYGVQITDEDAELFMTKVLSFNPSYTLFMKHWLPDHMPPTYRHPQLSFISDSQNFKDLDGLLANFIWWANWLPDATVGYQYGYPNDENWWSLLERPTIEITETVINAIPTAKYLFWVDFSAGSVEF